MDKERLKLLQCLVKVGPEPMKTNFVTMTFSKN